MRIRLLITINITFLFLGVTTSSLFITNSNTWMFSLPISIIGIFLFVIDLTKNGYKVKPWYKACQYRHHHSPSTVKLI